MTYEQTFVLLVTAGAAVAFVSERVRSEVVALCVLCALALSGVVSPREALSGFSSEAVVTVAAMFILSAALEHGGGLLRVRRLLTWTARTPSLLRAALMPIAGALSAFVNNTACVAVLLPAVTQIARRKRWSPRGS